jgi:hypothetical protein
LVGSGAGRERSCDQGERPILLFYRTRPAILPFTDEKLTVATEGLLQASLERLFRTLRSKRASKETKVRGILEFHFTNEAAVRSFLEDMGMVEE